MRIKSNKKNINRGGDGGQVIIFGKNIKGDGPILVDGGNGPIGGNAGKIHIEAENYNYKGKISAKGGKSLIVSSELKKEDEILKLSPEFYGIGINLKALGRKILRKIRNEK